ncbi:MAG TPA: thiamine pyrophosphate-dependent enzyme [Opitutaceae bacterium]|jgi:2-oxoisovalerate dehydrogenase E1 component|nr:thiamine pyrophosphate-dependent enzyme [Opitutaceae bacterium]
MAFPKAPAILASRDLRGADLEKNPTESLLKIYGWMHLARTADNRILDLFRQGIIKGTVTGGQGNEWMIVPLALLADKSNDVVSFTHRGFGGHLIWSGHLCEHLNQYFANANSPTRAREGNIHHGDPANRSLPMISHLGAMLGPVLGATDSQRRFGRQAVGFTFFGDGSSSTGDIHESMNLASLLSLPIVFVIENNRYAYSTPTEEQYAAGTELYKRAAGYGMEGMAINCGDPVDTAKAFARVIEKVRSTSRPMLVEAHTLRLRGHAAYDTCDYLKPGESDLFFATDPLAAFRKSVVDQVGEEKVAAIDTELGEFIEACIKVAIAVPRPDPAGMEDDLFAPVSKPFAWKPELEGAGTLTMAQSINAGLRKVLVERPESIVLGQDIATYGGAFKVTENLYKEFGRKRVFNTPLAESSCTGYAIGMAVNGHRPIEEFQFADFATEAATQITLNAATMHFRSGAACPVVFRMPCGAVGLGSFHSEELESFFLAMPGIKALYPSNPQDAFNSVLAACEENNPVMLFEHKGLYRRGKHPVKWDPDYRKVWKPKQVRPGSYATLVTYGEAVHVAMEACAYLADEYDADIEVFDLCCLSPLDLTDIMASVERTGRLIVLHEGRRTHGFGAEVVARITEGCETPLKAPPLRIAAMDLPVPFAAELEAAFRPSKDKAIQLITGWMS